MILPVYILTVSEPYLVGKSMAIAVDANPAKKFEFGDSPRYYTSVERTAEALRFIIPATDENIEHINNLISSGFRIWEPETKDFVIEPNRGPLCDNYVQFIYTSKALY